MAHIHFVATELHRKRIIQMGEHPKRVFCFGAPGLDNLKRLTFLNRKEFEESINNDLDMPNALQVLWKLVRDQKANGKLKTIKIMDEVFGLDLLKTKKISIPSEIKKLVKERETARKNKNWDLSDKLRDKINKLGYTIDDTKEGSIVKKK